MNMKDKGIDISFIIPVYNGEVVVRRMTDSICRLPEDISIEVIAVDDGSSDRSFIELYDIAFKDDRVKLIHTKNRGQSSARNTGFSAARGKYVFFADADDEVIPEGILKLYKEAEKGSHDITCGTYIRKEPGKSDFQALKGLKSGSVSRDGRGKKLFGHIKTKSAFGYVWNKLYKKAFLEENGLRFDESIKVYMEDQLLNLKAFACGADWYFLNEPVYIYHFEGESTTRRADPDIAEKSAAMLRSYDAYLKERGAQQENQDLFTPLAMRMAAWAAFKNIAYEGADRKKIRERLEIFSDEEGLRYMLEHEECRAYLTELPSKLQRKLFTLTYDCLKEKKEGKLAGIFALASPMMKAASKMVR